ncbi:hypothetical protein NQ314_008934 [Rhamnusium bicolor]|uniref:DUF4806 domain-containing protein n=1 Tax=Rhamnusium bicolor TaxID=1586634 RepID=A0AAV8Y5H4_9CUCU|nr:hypothetical protein NQ314_008934 [Rhamnusium bicolor]
MTFVGVEFAANEGLAIVSVNWLTPRKKEVFWPDSKKQSCYEKLLKNHTIPDEDSWHLFPIQRCFFNTELTSDLQSDESDSELLQSRKVRARKRPISESSDSGDSDESKQTCELKRPEKISINILKPKDDLADTISLVSDLDANTARANKDFEKIESSIPRSINLPSPRTPLCENSDVPVDTNSSISELVRSPIPEILGSSKARNLILGIPGSSKVRSPIPETPSGSLTSGSSFSTPKINRSSTLRENFALESNDKLLSSIFYVREQNKLIISLLTQIINKQSSENAYGILEEIPHLPINNEEDFTILENYLESDDNLKKLVNYLQKLGGKDAICKVNIILKKILTNELASGYNYFGKRPGKKNHFQLYDLMMLLLVDQGICDNIILEPQYIVRPTFINPTNSSGSSDVDFNYDTDSSEIFIPLKDQLRHWAVTTSVSHSSVTSLLHILSPYYPNELPLDCRTLLRTPTHMVAKKLNSGEYSHIGFEKSCIQILERLSDIPDNLEIAFNIDGIPLFKSSSLQLWPILAQIKNIKSSPFAEFNSPLQSGLQFQNKNYSIELHSFICDAQARSFLKCVKSHTGYSSCEKCTDGGEYFNGRMIFLSTNKPLRTDTTFLQQLDEDHHLDVSPLINLPIGMVSQFPINYMHNCCLRIMRKLLNSGISGKLPTRLGSTNVKLLSDVLVSLKKHIPVELNRKPRTLSELPRWKATEFRTFILYLGPVVLKKFLNIAVYEHFFIVGSLLKLFVDHCVAIYGKEFLIYNIHTICHLHKDVQKFGVIDNFSAFPFENYLSSLKRMVKSTINPLQEIYNRIHEMNSCASIITTAKNYLETKFEHSNGPLHDNIQNKNIKQFKKLIIKNITLSICTYSKSDCFCMMNDEVLEIHNIIVDNNNIHVVGKKFTLYESLYNYPLSSKLLKVYLVSNLSKEFYVWHVFDHVLTKCILLPYERENKKWASMPIIHSLM